jgi:CBS domain-containing protein
MDEPISAMMQAPAVTVDMDDSAAQVEAIMREHDVSAVPVIDRTTGLVTGIISAADLARPAGLLHAWEICSYKPVEVGPDTPMAEVARRMLARGIHHVVVTEDRQVVGMVSSLDFVKRFLRESQGGNEI